MNEQGCKRRIPEVKGQQTKKITPAYLGRGKKSILGADKKNKLV